MLHEFAVDPQGLGRFGPMWILMDQFGVSKGRIICKFPGNWTRLVYDAICTSDCPDVEKKSIVNRLNRLKQSLGKLSESRQYSGQEWLNAAIQSHAQQEFKAIVCDTADPRCAQLLTPRDATEDNPNWSIPTGCVIPRTARRIAACAAPLGKISKQLLFVDPYLSGDPNRTRVIREALRACGAQTRSFGRIELHATDKCGVLSEFARVLQKSVIEELACPIEIAVFQWDFKESGDRMHPRYFLTERGGIRFDYGFAEGNAGETTDVQLLNDELYLARWNDYQPNSAAFNLRDKLVVK